MTQSAELVAPDDVTEARETKEATEAASPDGAAPAAPPASHDSPPPKALVDFMLQGWMPPTGAMPPVMEHADVFRARRQALSALYPGETLVVATGHLKVRSNDTHYRFRPSSDFYYLTGNLEPDCVLVLEPVPAAGAADGARGHRDILFAEPNPGRSDATFFTDRIKGALWVGPRLGVPETRARYAVDECRPLGELAAYLQGVAGGGRPFRVVRGFSPRVDADLVRPEGSGDADKAFATALSEMRLLKDALEVAELRAVVESTRRGFEDVIKRLPKARSEREVEGVFGLRARVEGNDVGYGTIAAAGAHACVLHWTHNDGPLVEGELLLLDAGVEGNSLYTADITRTLPISGSFTRAQRAIYKLVYKAQKAAFARVKPGNDFMDPNKAAMRVLAEGLEKLGILTHHRRATRSRRSTSSTSATRSTTSATCSASTSTTAPRPARRRTSSASCGRGWCSPWSRGSTSRPTTSPCPRSTAASASASRTTWWSPRTATRTSPPASPARWTRSRRGWRACGRRSGRRSAPRVPHPPRLLVVEDDASVAQSLVRGLAQAGFAVELAADGALAREVLARDAIDLVVLDLMLPRVTGLDLLVALADRPHPPIIVLTARVDLDDRLRSFALGAVDFVAKPFFLEELVARVRARLRLAAEAPSQVVAWGDVAVDLDRRLVHVGGEPVTLTRYELDVLVYLVQRPGRAVTRDQLAERALSGVEAPEPRTIDTHIARVRKKLGPAGAAAIGTVWGIGYRFDPPRGAGA